MSILLELPVPVVQGADLPGLEPPGDAVEVEGVVAHAPRDGALLGGRRRLVGLALDAEVHDVVAADGAVVHHDIPGPQRHGVPLLHLEPLLVLALQRTNVKQIAIDIPQPNSPFPRWRGQQ